MRHTRIQRKPRLPRRFSRPVRRQPLRRDDWALAMIGRDEPRPPTGVRPHRQAASTVNLTGRTSDAVAPSSRVVADSRRPARARRLAPVGEPRSVADASRRLLRREHLEVPALHQGAGDPPRAVGPRRREPPRGAEPRPRRGARPARSRRPARARPRLRRRHRRAVPRAAPAGRGRRRLEQPGAGAPRGPVRRARRAVAGTGALRGRGLHRAAGWADRLRPGVRDRVVRARRSGGGLLRAGGPRPPPGRRARRHRRRPRDRPAGSRARGLQGRLARREPALRRRDRGARRRVSG